MSGIFISYRREDTSPYAGRLRDRLGSHFGAHQIFRDVDRIAPGESFPSVIKQAVGSCDALLALIGPAWLSVEDEDGRRRLDDPDDYLRQEIAAALDRRILVVPVLIGPAQMPDRETLPDRLAPLADHQALRLSDEGWDDQVVRLIRRLESVVRNTAGVVPGSMPPRPRPDAGVTAGRPPSRFSAAGARARAGLIVAALVALVGTGVVISRSIDGGADTPDDRTRRAVERSVSLDGSPQDVNLARDEYARFGFTVPGGRRVSATLAPASFDGPVDFSITYAGGNAVPGASDTVTTGDTGFIEADEPLSAGTYKVVVRPQGTAKGRGTIQLFEVEDQAGTIATGGPPQEVHLARGEYARFGFTAPGGRRVSATLAPASFDGPVDFSITYAGGNAVPGASDTVTAGDTGFIDVPGVLGAGSYTLVVSPQGTTKGSGTVRLFEVEDQAGTIATDGPAQEVKLTTPGQNAAFGFTVPGGRRVSATLAPASFDGPVDFSITYAGGNAVPGAS
ncbi:MAG: TIR domain-containing protein, partial [Acidimicrobiales bacterium]